MERLNLNNKELQLLLPEIVKNNLAADVSDLRYIGGGSFGKVYKATLSSGEAIALKAFRRQGAQQEEATQLRTLSQNTAVKMPEVLFIHADDKTAVMGMSFIEGKNVLNPMFLLKSKAQKARFAEDVVSGMLQWHNVKSEKFGDLNNPTYDTWHAYYRKEKQEPWLKALCELSDKGKYSRKNLDLLYRATELFNKVHEEPESPVLIHGDLNIMNIMAESKTFTLTGFIDPCGSIWAHREYDLFQLHNMWGNSFGLYETYKSKYKLSEYADFRVAYYGAMHEAAMRLSGGLIMPLWEELNNIRLKREMKRLKY